MQTTSVIDEITGRFPEVDITQQSAADGTPTIWIDPARVRDVLTYLKNDATYRMLYDLTAVDERARRLECGASAPLSPRRRLECGALAPLSESGAKAPHSMDFTVLYHLLSFDRNSDVRLKVPLQGEYPSIRTITDLWPNANWYEREAWDMFGIKFEGHPFLERILMPPGWQGHPLRKEHPARATDMEGYVLPDDKALEEERDLQVHPEKFGLMFRDLGAVEDGMGAHSPNPETSGGADYMFLNFGPHHPGTHGLLRAILQLDGEQIANCVMDIGWHHRGAEKMAERQTFHTFIPYTDRVDYLSGVQNNLPYVLTVEKLAGIEVPMRARVIRVMMCELFRIANHLVWLGTFGADVGAMSPVFFTFNDRERVFEIVEAVCGGRMHPAWFRIGGVASDLPNGWKELVDGFLRYFPPRIEEYDRMLATNSIFRQRTKGVGAYSTQSAIEWGVTGPNLRSTGFDWDLRKRRPYSAYDQFDFEVPTATEGDCHARCVVRLEEMRQSLRIVKQAAENMPEGDYMSDSPLAMPPRKARTMTDIETLINHFLSVSWGRPVPAGEAMVSTEAPKGNCGYYVVSDGGNWPYRCRIRAPSFAHMQSVPMLTRGLLISDLIAILGSIDYVLADVDR